jgi:succinyl-CoA synthetase beta subunit
MHIHEYQAKTLLSEFGIKIPHAVMITQFNEVSQACERLGNAPWVVKAQVHAGARGKGGGVVVCHHIEAVEQACKKLLNQRLITPQTDMCGLPVDKILIEAGQEIACELYLSFLVDRQNQEIALLASTEGGMDIESVAENQPEKIIKLGLNLGQLGVLDCALVADKLGVTEELLLPILAGISEIFTQFDASLIEINPLIQTKNGDLMALDCKMEFDDNALYRQPNVLALRDIMQEDEKEVQAHQYQLNYISLDGTIGCMVNGAGLAMATLDLIAHHGGSPANFLDVGGGTTPERVAKAFELIQSEPNVRGVLVNIFGGIVRCDLIAQGILQAIEKVGLNLPIVVRLEGTNAQAGLALLQASEFEIEVEADLTKAAVKIVELAK